MSSVDTSAFVLELRDAATAGVLKTPSGVFDIAYESAITLPTNPFGALSGRRYISFEGDFKSGGIPHHVRTYAVQQDVQVNSDGKFIDPPGDFRVPYIGTVRSVPRDGSDQPTPGAVAFVRQIARYLESQITRRQWAEADRFAALEAAMVCDQRAAELMDLIERYRAYAGLLRETARYPANPDW